MSEKEVQSFLQGKKDLQMWSKMQVRYGPYWPLKKSVGRGKVMLRILEVHLTEGPVGGSTENYSNTGLRYPSGEVPGEMHKSVKEKHADAYILLM